MRRRKRRDAGEAPECSHEIPTACLDVRASRQHNDAGARESCSLDWSAAVPTATAPGGSTFTLTVNGTGFVSGAVVSWNGTALATTFVNSSQLTATVPALSIASAGTALITVSNPAPGGGTSNVLYFDVSSPASSVTVTQLQPNPISFGSFLITADFNGDGRLDLAYLDATASKVFIQLGNGDGTFRVPVTYSVGSVPQGLVAGDFNGDGRPTWLSATRRTTRSLLS